MSNINVEQVFIDFLYRATEKEFTKLIKKRKEEMKKIVEDEFTEDRLREMVIDCIEYNDEFHSAVAEMTVDIVKDKYKRTLEEIFK